MIRVGLPLLAFFYLNALFTFANVPSTPALALAPRLSLEVLLLVGLLAALAGLSIPLCRAGTGALAAVVLAAGVVRYVEVTAVGVLGRPFDLYGDFPHLHRVFAMFWDAVAWTTMVPIVAGLAAAGLAVFLLAWAAIRALERAFGSTVPRRMALGGALLGVVAFPAAGPRFFSEPVAAAVLRHVASLRAGGEEGLASVELPEEPRAANVAGLGGANVFVIFLESYGVTLIEDPHHREIIAPRYHRLEERLQEAGYSFASSQIQSPTFGGGSWRAHASLLSGVHVDSQHVYDALLASERRTLVSVLKENGYRTIAAEPGIKWYWPDGRFYGFDAIYDFDALGYDGPAMGWWRIPDQFTLYRIYKEEILRARQPLFVKFSLITTHIPYFPVPSYVPQWSRFDEGTAFETGLRSVAHDAYRDLAELSTWYLDAFAYELDNLEGFLLELVPDPSLVIVVGDHQPPKLATHDNDSWAVPMHVFSKRERLVRAFDALGFEPGLLPRAPSALRMADFVERFLELYHVQESD